jgi:hypothetical protein
LAASKTQPRLQRLRFEGTCASCRTAQPPGTEAWWYADKKEIVCVSCRQLKRHARIGNLILHVTDEPQTTRSWGSGAGREKALGARLDELADERLVVLHDRRISASRGKIDHLAVTPGGVFVIDSERYSGKLEKRNLGNVLRSDVRLYVGGRDRTNLLQGVEDQAEVVRAALKPAGYVDVPIRAVLCFIGAELFASPFKLGNVLVTYPKFLYELLGKNTEIKTSAIQDAARVLAMALQSA